MDRKTVSPYKINWSNFSGGWGLLEIEKLFHLFRGISFDYPSWDTAFKHSFWSSQKVNPTTKSLELSWWQRSRKMSRSCSLPLAPCSLYWSLWFQAPVYFLLFWALPLPDPQSLEPRPILQQSAELSPVLVKIFVWLCWPYLFLSVSTVAGLYQLRPLWLLTVSAVWTDSCGACLNNLKWVLFVSKSMN